MKKIKRIEVYRCDYCGKECEHTPEYVMPDLENKYEKRSSIGDKPVQFRESILPKQRDICPDCQREIAKFLRLMTYTVVKMDDVEKTIFDNFNKVISSCEKKPVVCGSKESIEILNELVNKFGKLS